jgi:pilus assembly protein Flp/PilA
MRKLNSFKNRRGQGLVEYIIIVASVAMISLVAVSVFGHKVADQYAIGAGMLPGAHSADNQAIATGFFAGTTADASGNVIANGRVSWADIASSDADGSDGLANNVVVAGEAAGATEGDAFVAD